jgi:hypothetical protein
MGCDYYIYKRLGVIFKDKAINEEIIDLERIPMWISSYGDSNIPPNGTIVNQYKIYENDRWLTANNNNYLHLLQNIDISTIESIISYGFTEERL